MPIKKRPVLIDYLGLSAAAIVMALNYQIFILENQFAPAGINGLATMAQYLFQFSIGYMSLIINIPLALVTYFTGNKAFALRTLTFVLVFSACMLIFSGKLVDLGRFIYHTDDGKSAILAPIASGTINGFIYAFSIGLGGSTGGTDFVAAFIHRKHPEFSMMHVIFTINTIVACLSYFVYDCQIEPVILCIIYCYITSTISDNRLKGGHKALKVEMITAHPDEITDRIIKELRHTATIIDVRGGYTHDNKTMLVAVINKHQITHFTNIIREYPDTFACVSDVNETLGNFKKIKR